MINFSKRNSLVEGFALNTDVFYNLYDIDAERFPRMHQVPLPKNFKFA